MDAFGKIDQSAMQSVNETFFSTHLSGGRHEHKVSKTPNILAPEVLVVSSRLSKIKEYEKENWIDDRLNLLRVLSRTLVGEMLSRLVPR